MYDENWYENSIISAQMRELDTEIAEYMRRHPVEHMPPKVRSDVLIETPPIRYRPLRSAVYPGWTRKCPRCVTVQTPFNGQFLTFYHECPNAGTVEWPASIGREYA